MELKVGNFVEVVYALMTGNARNERNWMEKSTLMILKSIKNEKICVKLFYFSWPFLCDSAWDASSRGSVIAPLLCKLEQ